MLDIKEVFTAYDSIKVLNKVSMSVSQDEIVAIIGANGAGKSTLAKAIVGLVKVQRGEISFLNQKISNMPPHEIAKFGISLVPEGRQIFGPLTVWENLRLGTYLRAKSQKKAVQEDLDLVYSLFPILSERMSQKGGMLSGGEQQMLAIGRALMARPKLLVLDEPSLGLAPKIIDSIYLILNKLNTLGLTLFLIEQNAEMAINIAKKCYVMEVGSIIFRGEAADLKSNQKLIDLYLGG